MALGISGLLNLFKKSPMSHVEKERYLVQHVSINKMRQFTNMPYLWDSKIKKFVEPNCHPFAYMDLTYDNISIAKSELSKMNRQLSADASLSSAIPNGIAIPIQDIIFHPSYNMGYTRLMCTPFTFDGEISKYPISLSFMTDLMDTNSSTHGDLFYGQKGCIEKAEIYFWKNCNGLFFFYDTIGAHLTLSRVEIPRMDTSGRNDIVYKGPHVLAMEASRLKEETAFNWLQRNLPHICPKSLSGYRRMKTQNTKNYQKLVAAAKYRGFDL